MTSAAAGSSKGGWYAAEDSFKNTCIRFHVLTASIKDAPRRAIASDCIFYRKGFFIVKKAVQYTRIFSSFPTHFRTLHFIGE